MTLSQTVKENGLTVDTDTGEVLKNEIEELPESVAPQSLEKSEPTTSEEQSPSITPSSFDEDTAITLLKLLDGKMDIAWGDEYDDWRCRKTEVAIHGLHVSKCYVKDMEYNYFSAMGYRVGWFAEGIQTYGKWYERGWCFAGDKYYDPYAPFVNMEVVDRLPEYKYSAYRQYKGYNIFKYLRMYEKYPHTEMFVKFGLSAYALSKQLLEKTAKDKKFRKWLIGHRAELSAYNYYISTILLSYKTGKSLDDAQQFEQQKRSFCNKNGSYPELRRFFCGRTDTFLEYVQKQDTSIRYFLLHQDYLLLYIQ